MVYFRTCAYNAEKTIRQAIESILNQTCQKFQYYILDSGSTDGTNAIIQEYAKADSRIHAYHIDVNNDLAAASEFWRLSHNIPEGSYFCVLDADDYYAPTFLEEMLVFVKKYDLDIGMCGTVFIDAEKGMSTGARVLERDIILSSPEDYAASFSDIYWNLRQNWGKLYSAKAAQARYEVELPDWYPRAYGGDTVDVLECVKASDKVGIYSKVLHTYRVSKKSVSHQWINGRVEADVIVFEKGIEFLKNKCGDVSVCNLRFLLAVYFNAINDTTKVIFQSDLDMGDKIAEILKIMRHRITHMLYSMDLSENMLDNARKQRYTYGIVEVILDQGQMLTKSHCGLLKELFDLYNPQFSGLFNEDCVLWLVRNDRDLVRYLLGEQYENAFSLIQNKIKTEKESLEAYMVMQTLAALLEREEEYVAACKAVIRLWISMHRYEEAEAELTEWLAIMPEDKEIRELCREIHACMNYRNRI